MNALEGFVHVDIIKTLNAFLDFCYTARLNVLTEDSLNALDTALGRFHHYREIFRTSGVRPDGFSLPRQHSLKHYRRHIENFGALNGLCSSITESKHIIAVKKPWRRSGRYEALRQMLVINTRNDKLAAARTNFSSRGMLKGTCLGETLQLWHSNLNDNNNADNADDADNDTDNDVDNDTDNADDNADSDTGDVDNNTDDVDDNADDNADDNVDDNADDNVDDNVDDDVDNNADDDEDNGFSGPVEGPPVLSEVVLAQKRGTKLPFRGSLRIRANAPI